MSQISAEAVARREQNRDSQGRFTEHQRMESEIGFGDFMEQVYADEKDYDGEFDYLVRHHPVSWVESCVEAGEDPLPTISAVLGDAVSTPRGARARYLCRIMFEAKCSTNPEKVYARENTSETEVEQALTQAMRNDQG